MKFALFLSFLALASARPHNVFEEYAKKFPNTATEPDPEYLGVNGDIIVEEGVEDSISPLNAITNLGRCWPDGLIHFTLSSAFTPTEVQLIQAGIDDLVDSTRVNGEKCIDIQPRTSQQAYVNVAKGSGCSSVVGRSGGAQSMSLAAGCVTRHGTIMHEFLHAYGYYHEQSRWDRDDFVWVNFDNIQPGRENNFRKYEDSQIQTLGTTYDYGSVMHYGPYGFAIDPSVPTIVPHDPEAEIGQRIELSELDIERVQIFYGCITPAESKFHRHLTRTELLVCPR